MLTGDFDVFIDVDNNYDVLCLSYKKAGNDFKLMPYKLGPKAFCDLIKNEKMIYPEVLPVTNFPQNTCPWPKGNYHVHG